MLSRYDEDLTQNKFFVALRCNYWDVLQKAISSGCAVCIPCRHAVDEANVAEDDILSNILIPVPVCDEVGRREFKSLVGRPVLKDGANLYVDASASGQCRIRAGILFHEEFHSDGGQKYDVLCISRSLRDRGADEEKGNPSRETLLSSVACVGDCVKFLKANVSSKTLTKLDYTIHRTLKSLHEAPSVSAISFKIESVFQIVLAAVGDVEPELGSVLPIALESYILHDAYKPIIDALKRTRAAEDAQLNVRRRAITNQPDYAAEFHVRPEFFNLLLKVRRELDRVPSFRTPAEKLEGLSSTMKLVSEHASNLGLMTTTDDYLPILICALVDSSYPSWLAELDFLKHFRLAKNDSDEKAYYIASLEAGLEHLKTTTHVNRKWLMPSFNDPVHASYRKFAEELWVAIEANDCAAMDTIVSEVRKSGALLSRRLCHPLCSCLDCVDIKRLETDTAGGLINCPDDFGRTPLHIAANVGHAKVLEHVIARGARVNDADNLDYRTPLHVAAASGHTDAVLLLLYAGADANVRDSHGRTCLHAAAAAGHKNCVNALLYFAAHSGLDLSSGDANGDTALHLASAWGYHDVAAALLEHKANPSKKNARGESAVDVAANPVIVDLLKTKLSEETCDENCNRRSYMFSPKSNSKWSSIFGKKDRSKNGLKSDVDPRVEKCFRAITLGDVRLACYYLGIDPFASSSDVSPPSNRRKCHPLCACPSCSSSEKNPEILDVNCQNTEGYVPLHIAALHNRIEMVKALLVNDADPNRTTDRGMTPLHLACQCNLVDVAKILLAFQADLSVRDDAGNSALHYACILGNVELARILLAFGAADAGVNTNKRTPSMEAKERRFFDVLRLFGV